MRLQEIKWSNKRRKNLSHDRKNDFSMLREIEYQRLVDKSVDDIEYLINRIERYEAVLKDISTNYDCDSDAHKYGTPCRACRAEEALKEEAPTD